MKSVTENSEHGFPVLRCLRNQRYIKCCTKFEQWIHCSIRSCATFQKYIFVLLRHWCHHTGFPQCQSLYLPPSPTSFLWTSCHSICYYETELWHVLPVGKHCLNFHLGLYVLSLVLAPQWERRRTHVLMFCVQFNLFCLCHILLFLFNMMLARFVFVLWAMLSMR